MPRGSLPCLACQSRRKQRSLRQKKRHDKPYQQKGYGHRGQSWSQGASQQQPPPPPPPPPQSGQEPSDQQDADARYDIKEATEAEELASAARKRQQEEESWHESLWRDAVRTAVHDENRPRSARELVREGKMGIGGA